MLEILTGNPFFGSCLLASILMLAWRYIYRDPFISWPHVLFPPVWSVVSTLVLGASALLLPLTLDHYLYAADGSFGFQASFFGARLLLRNPWLRHTSEICYFNLPLAMVLMYLVLKRCSVDSAASDFVRFAIYLGIAGTALYFVYPAVGPSGAFKAEFPYRTPITNLIPISVPMAARNCMPSLHTAWTLCLLWCTPLVGRPFRPILWAFAFFTLTYTLSAGGHYLVDMIVAVPFAQAVRAAARSQWRSSAFLQNAVLTFVWLLLLRHGIALFTSSRALTYALTVFTLLSSLITPFSSRKALSQLATEGTWETTPEPEASV